MEVDMSIRAKGKRWFAIRQKAWDAFTDDFFTERDNGRMTDAQRWVILNIFSIAVFASTLLIEPPTLQNSSMEYCAFSNFFRLLHQLPGIALIFYYAWKLYTEARSFVREVLLCNRDK